MQIHHITILTKDVDRDTKFYTEVLGFRFLKNSVNQERPENRHVFYGDYIGTPGTITSIIEVPRMGHRYDDGSFIKEINYYAPAGSEKFWQDRLNSFGIKYRLENAQLFFQDPDEVELSLTFIDEQLPQNLVNSKTDIPAADQILRMKSTKLVVFDLETERKFFADMTGLPVADNHLELDFGQSIDFELAKNHDKKRFGRGSIDHVALSATSIDEIHEIRKRGELNKYHFEEEIDRLYFYSLYFKDPFDNRIEFATMAPGFTVDENLDQLGSKLGLPKRLESRREELTKHFAQ